MPTLMKKTSLILVVCIIISSFILCSCSNEQNVETTVVTETIVVTEKPTEFNYSKNPDDYVEVAREEEHADGEIVYRIPHILIKSEDAKTVNNDIDGIYNSVFDIYDQVDRNGRCTSLGYDAYVAKEVLSVVITMEYHDTNFYSVYNFDIRTGKRLLNDELINKLGYTEEDVYSKLKDATAKWFTDRFSDLTDEDDYKDCYDRTISDDNLASSHMFIDTNGKLVAYVPIAYLGSTKMYDELIEIE